MKTIEVSVILVILTLLIVSQGYASDMGKWSVFIGAGLAQVGKITSPDQISNEASAMILIDYDKINKTGLMSFWIIDCKVNVVQDKIRSVINWDKSTHFITMHNIRGKDVPRNCIALFSEIDESMIRRLLYNKTMSVEFALVGGEKLIVEYELDGLIWALTEYGG